MENSEIEELLDRAQTRFERPGSSFEVGLDIDDPSRVQLRKACRMIDAGRFLDEADGYYTLIVEASFAAIERTIQFYLLDTGMLHEEEYLNHQRVYEQGAKAGLYTAEFAGKLINLWRNNRSDTYYREGIATAERASSMLDLAEAVHFHVLHLAGESHDCICDTA